MQLLSRFWRNLFILLLLTGSMVALTLAQASVKTAAEASARPLITQSIDESRLVTLAGTRHPLATPTADQGEASGSMLIGRTMLMLRTSDARQAALKKLVDDQQNSKSAIYHKWLTPEQYGAKFGAAPQDIQKITQWLEGYGLQVEASMPGRNLVIFSGTHAQLKSAFHITLHSYKVNGQSYYANASDPQIPAALAPAVAGFVSLNNFPRNPQHTTPQIIHRDKSSWKSTAAANRPRALFTTAPFGQTLQAIGPYDLATIYNIKPLWDAGIDGTGQTIAIVSNSDINPADVDYFRSTFGLPATKLNLLYYGVNPGPTSSEGEADLDVEWAGAVAKNATIDLVIAADTPTSAGIDAAAVYIINNNLASLLNVSYGECELGLGTGGNQYYNTIWEQAAAQGITVLTAAGDAGSAVCDSNQPYAQNGLSVSGLASTPYSVGVGGTDFYASYVNPDKYWNADNDSATLESALSYIPETPWNNSCASPELLGVFQTEGATDKTTEAACNDVNIQYNFLTTAAGSGGASNCATLNSDGTACSSGNPKPAWQTGISGIPNDGVRDLPDVSLMAGNGTWNTFYVYCQSDATGIGVCDVNNALEGAGGTSFASPIFAGMLALVQQKTASQQGNVNYTLYKLAATQYAKSGNASSCSSATVASGNGCIFYDVTEGTNAVPCLGGTTDCTPKVTGDQFGILPGYDAGEGFDLATGLGSINANNLVNGWSSASSTFLPSATTLAATGTTTAAYGTPINVTVAVSPTSSGSGTPSGDVAILTDSTLVSNNSVAEATLSNGQATIAANLMQGGTYQLLARYAGDATFAPSQSAGVAVTITPAVVSGAALVASRTSIAPGQYVSFTFSVPGIANGVNPTGTVTFTNATTGKPLSTQTIATGSSTAAIPVSVASISVPFAQLASATNSIIATYSGDSNYAATGPVSASVSVTSPFTASINPAALTLAPNTSGTVSVVVTPSGNTPLDPTLLNFSCPSNLPAGLACSFSAPVAASGGAVTSTLTLQTASPLFVKHARTASEGSDSMIRTGAVASLAGFFLLGFPARRRRIYTAFMLAAFVTLSFTIGCGGGSHTTTTPSLIASTTALSISPSTPALNAPVTLTANVTAASGTGSPTGTVTFLSGSTSLGTGTLASGTATFSAKSLPIGTQTITAAYGGDTSYAASSSSAVSVDVAFTSTISITVFDAAGDSSAAQLAITVQ